MIDELISELEIIGAIYKAQFQKYNAADNFPYPLILDRYGKAGVDGSYMASIDIFSDIELFNLRSYRKHLRERFENSNDTTIFKKELNKALKIASEVRDFYNVNLTKGTKLVAEYLYQKNDSTKGITTDYFGCVFIENYRINKIYIGSDRSSLNRAFRQQSKYTYVINNNELATWCQIAINFLEKFEADRSSKPDEIYTQDSKGALKMIDEKKIDIFLKVESAALPIDKNNFTSAIRCAAFCEILYSRGIILHTKTSRKTMEDFAAKRYGQDIRVCLTNTKKDDREKHKTKKVKDMRPLKGAFFGR